MKVPEPMTVFDVLGAIAGPDRRVSCRGSLGGRPGRARAETALPVGIDEGDQKRSTGEMGNLRISLDLPRDLIGALDIPESDFPGRIKELIALELYREGHVSSGKAAELLGWSKLEFVRLLARHDIPYFRQSPDELAREVAAIEGASGRPAR